jgi:hypothetical protein
MAFASVNLELLFITSIYPHDKNISDCMNIFRKKLSAEKAEMLGLLCAEGSHYKYIAIYNRFFPKRGRYYTTISTKEQIDFTNLNTKLLQYFQHLLNIVYNYNSKITGIPTSLKIHITKKNIIKDLLQYTDFGFDEWKVPNDVKIGTFNIKTAFVKGVYEGDGVKLQINKYGTPYLFFDMKNKNSLEELRILLSSIGITARINKNSKSMTRLLVYGIEDVMKFKKFINPKFKKVNLKLGWQKANRLHSGNAHQKWVESPAEREIVGPNPTPSSFFRKNK